MTQINLLPWREQQRQDSKIQLAIVFSIGLGLALLVVLLAHFYMTSLIKTQQKRVNFLTSELAQIKTDMINLNKQKEQVTQVESALNFIIGLRAKSFRAVHLLNQLAAVTPESITLISVMRDKDLVLLEGEAQSDLDITQLMKRLSGLPGFTQPVLTEISAKKEPPMTERYFRLKVNQQG